MVTEQDHPLDELILQVFEEQEEQFYFPITTQNSARMFVKALHTSKGFSYEKMYKEIEEFEHNFSAWRKGLGRVGIGNRVMERINRPLEEVLLSEDEDDVNEIISRIRGNKDEGVVAVSRPENDRVPPITSVVNTEETRLIKMENAIRRSSSDAAATNRTKDTSASSAGNESKVSDNKEPRKELTESWRNNIENKIKKLEEGRTAPDSPKLHKVTKLPGAELEQKQPGLVDFRSVLKRRTPAEGGDKKAPGAGDRRSMPPNLGGSLELSSSSGMSSLSGSADTLFRPDTSSSSSITTNGTNTKAKLKDYTIRAKSEPRILPPKEEEKVRPKDLDLEEKTTDNSKKDLFEEKNDVEKEFLDEKEFDSFEEHVAEIKVIQTKVTAAETKASAPLAAVDDEDLSSASLSSESESGHSSDSGVNESSSNKDEQDTKHEVDDGNGSEENSEEEEEEEAVSENYDSDLDQTNEDLTREGRQIADQVANYKSKVGSRDGPGYLYAFRDSSSGKVKVGESRVPKKRLEQALWFNINLELVSALPVSLRKLAVQRAQGRLKRYRVDGHDGWFDGPMDEIIDTVTSTAERYPKNSSEC